MARGISVAKTSRTSVRSVSTAARLTALVVPEQLERLLGVRYASDMEQQADVEDINDLPLGQIHVPRHGRADETRPQCRFDGQAVSEIGNNRKTTEKIGKSKPFTHRLINSWHSSRVLAARMAAYQIVGPQPVSVSVTPGGLKS